jgi:hypothetical protein
MLEEANQEASLSPDFVQEHAQATGVITYVARHGETKIYSCINYGYELELPPEMIPVSGDPSEVAGFELLDIGEIQAAIFGGKFRVGCILPWVDFCIRHGIIIELARRLRDPLPVCISPISSTGEYLILAEEERLIGVSLPGSELMNSGKLISRSEVVGFRLMASRAYSVVTG